MASTNSTTAEAATKLPVNPQNLFTFPAGDIEIIVTYKGELVTGKVASTALVLASPVWKTFVHPPFPQLKDTTTAVTPAKEDGNSEGATKSDPSEAEKAISQASYQYTVPDLDFKDDDAEALLILLQIAHLQFTEIPVTLSFKQLLNVATLCDQYDCTKLVQPWIADWFAQESTMSVAPGNEQYLWIAWVFGRKEAFEALSKKLVKEVRVIGGPGPRICLSNSDQKLFDLMPEGIIENIMKVRQDTITKLFDTYAEIIHIFANARCSQNVEECTAMLCGSVMLPAINMGIWPPTTQESLTYSGSIVDFSTSLSQIKIHYYRGHRRCSAFGDKIRQAISAIVKDNPDPLLASHREHFKQLTFEQKDHEAEQLVGWKPWCA